MVLGETIHGDPDAWDIILTTKHDKQGVGPGMNFAKHLTQK